jgi:anti-anti-sigma factor
MAITTDISSENHEVTIGIDGRFDFSMVKEFRDAYSKSGDESYTYTLDLRNTEHIDSSALGMLLNMRKHLGESVPIKICNSRPQIKKILAISRFDKKFDIY